MTTREEDYSFGEHAEEALAAGWLAENHPEASLLRMKKFSDVDWAYQKDGALAGYIEVKRRRTAKAKYPTTIVSMRKHDAARAALKHFKVPTVCLVLFTDGAVSFDLSRAPAEVEDVARWDRPSAKPIPHGHWTVEKATDEQELFTRLTQAGLL